MAANRAISTQLSTLVPLVQGLAEMFGPNCEVVLHDLAEMPRSIVAIENGHVTGRRLGDVPTDQMLRSLRHADKAPDVRLYLTAHDDKILKSLAITMRGNDGAPIGILGVNFDVTGIVHAQRALSALAAVDGPDHEIVPDTRETFSGDIRDVLAAIIAAIVSEMGKSPAAMNRDEKMEVVKRLDERGAFLVKRSAEQVAEALDLSRHTIFSYLKEIRHDNGATRSDEPLVRDDV
jgi:predicted transcriptional regulator YheO